MPNDAKLGLIVGVGIVLAVAVVFFRKDGDAISSFAGETSAAAVGAAKTIPASSSATPGRPVKARPTGQTDSEPGTLIIPSAPEGYPAPEEGEEKP
jgi:hypothetical protein